MIKNMIVIVYLVVLSMIDIKQKKVPNYLLAVGVSCGGANFMFQIIQDKTGISNVFIELASDLALGGILLLAAATKKAGYADGIVLMGIGLIYGIKSVIFSFFFSIWMIALASVVLLALRKVKRDSELPYIPFITVGQVLYLLWEYDMIRMK